MGRKKVTMEIQQEEEEEKMIDSHCHLEQKDYDNDRDGFIENLKKELKAVVTCCASPKDLELTLQMVEKHKGFVFAVFGIHPEYVKEISEKEIEDYIELLKQNKDKVVGIGETGLDYFMIKEVPWQERQKELFIRLIAFAKELRKPLIIHSRGAYEDVIKILEQEDARNVLLHMWWEKKFINRINEKEFYVSIGPAIKTSKDIRRIARDVPLERILLETDSPWWGNGRGTPLNIKPVAEKIAEVKKISFEEVWRTCGANSNKFFDLGLII